MERDEDRSARQKSETGELDQREEQPELEDAGLPKQGDSAKDTRMGIVNEANFGTE